MINRTIERAQELAQIDPSRIRVVEWDKRNDALDGAALLVNATSQGMVGYPPLDVTLDALPVGAMVCDIVYNPLETPLLRLPPASAATALSTASACCCIRRCRPSKPSSAHARMSRTNCGGRWRLRCSVHPVRPRESGTYAQSDITQ